jgi:pyruvate-formate lyase-activating enzyme
MLLYVDVIDACHLKCPTCVRGVRAFPNTARKMPLDMFRAIVAKAKADGAYRVSIFSWIEPFLCRDLFDYTEAIRAAGLPCGMSSTLSLRRIPQFERTLRHVDLLTVSISGFDQETYEINHKGGNLVWVKENLERISALRQSGEIATEVTLRLLLFDYNRAHEAPLRDYASALGLRFEALLAAGHPLRAPQPANMRDKIGARLGAFSSERPHEPQGKVCPLIFEHVTLNAAGDVYQCTAYGNYDVLNIGPYLSLSREEVLLRRYMQPICNSCSWGRRAATETEHRLLQQALAHRMGLPIEDRVPQLSGPVKHRPLTADGHMVPKARAWL